MSSLVEQPAWRGSEDITAAAAPHGIKQFGKKRALDVLYVLYGLYGRTTRTTRTAIQKYVGAQTIFYACLQAVQAVQLQFSTRHQRIQD